MKCYNLPIVTSHTPHTVQRRFFWPVPIFAAAEMSDVRHKLCRVTSGITCRRRRQNVMSATHVMFNMVFYRHTLGQVCTMVRPVAGVLCVCVCGGETIILGGSQGVYFPRAWGVRGSSPEKIFENGGAETRFPGI